MNCLANLPIFLADASPGVYTYFSQSNMAGKFIVVALLMFSLIAWTLMIGKWLELRRLKDLNEHMKTKLGEAPSVVSVDPTKRMEGVGPFAGLVKSVMDAYYQFARLNDGGQKGKSLLMGHVESGLQRQVAEQSSAYESKMVMLGSIVSGAPFLGLLGTVWGVMDAFGSMALQSTASLQNLAPGVSGALLTTVAALLVAIPSVFGYNFLVSRTKQMVIELENFASVLADRVELELDR